jgi:GNAT superfamily N-acetyltransferase
VAGPPPVTVRPMVAADAADVARLCGQLGYPASAEAIAARFLHIARRRDQALLVAESEGRVVGWLHVAMHRTLECELMAEILGLVIDESARGGGIGRRLIAEAERWATEMSCPTVRVRSRVARERAHAFYERAGYRRIKTQHVFEKPLGSPS